MVRPIHRPVPIHHDDEARARMEALSADLLERARHRDFLRRRDLQRGALGEELPLATQLVRDRRRRRRRRT